MKVPFVDLQQQYKIIKSEIDCAISDVIANTSFIGGKYVKDFEEAFADFCDVSHCIGVGNGTDALYVALRALGIGQGDEVITAANSFIATSEAITMTGANVVFVDCDPLTYNIDPKKLEQVISTKTKAIIPVHLYGQPADMAAIKQVAQKYDLYVVEDAAQAHGAELDGQRVGTFGDLACFSFYPGKNLGAYGDAGAITTDNEDLARKCRMIANHGRIEKYNHQFEGVNSRLDGIQAAILAVKLKHLNQWTENRIATALLYNQYLKDSSVICPEVASGVKHVYHLFVVRVPKRDEVVTELKKRGIAVGIHYPIALPLLEAYSYLGHQPADFPVASQYADEILSLPIFPEIGEDQVKYVCEQLLDILKF